MTQAVQKSVVVPPSGSEPVSTRSGQSAALMSQNHLFGGLGLSRKWPMVVRSGAVFWLFGTERYFVHPGDFGSLPVALTQSFSREMARNWLPLAEFAVSVILIPWWLVTTSGCPGRCLSIDEVAVTCDAYQRMWGNEFALV